MYVGIQIVYSVWLKHLPVVDLAVVASGFLLRAIAGGVATGIPLSQWFLLVAAFGSFFMVAGKRYSEMKDLGADVGTRKSLTRYSESYLRFAWMLAAVMVLISYSLWAFENTRSVAAARSPVDRGLDRAVHPRPVAVRPRGRRRPGRRARKRSCCPTTSCKASAWSGW